MPNSSSDCRALVAAVSFVLVQGAASWGPGEHVAFAQPQPQKDEKKEGEQSSDEQKNAEGQKHVEEQKAAATARNVDQKNAEAEKKATPAEEEKKALDPDVESNRAVYFSGDLAFTRSNLGVASNDLGFDKTTANGILYGLSAGLRLKDVRFGLRWRVYDTTEFTLWAFALSAGYGLPIRPISPIFSVHLGYVYNERLQPGLFQSSLPQGNVLAPDVNVKGLLAGLDVNASYWVTHFMRIGAFIGVDAMFLSREQAPPPQSLFGPAPELNGNPLYANTGTSLGLNLNAGFRGTFDIGIQ